jgi:hypothetical protein
MGLLWSFLEDLSRPEVMAKNRGLAAAAGVLVGAPALAAAGFYVWSANQSNANLLRRWLEIFAAIVLFPFAVACFRLTWLAAKRPSESKCTDPE